MNNIHRTTWRSAIGIALVTISAVAQAQSASAPGSTGVSGAATTPPTATLVNLSSLAVGHAGFIKSVQGEVHLLGPAGELRPAQPGDALAPVDRIVTGANSGASAVLRDGTTLVVGSSSRMELKDFAFDATTQDGSLLVSLVRGSLRVITGLIGKMRPDAVRIETQTATISIRGTDFTTEVDGE